MTIGRIPGATGIQPTIVDAKGDIIAATAADSVTRLAAGANETRLVAASAEVTGLKYVADTTNYAVAAKGDLLAGTAADTVAALTVGANDTVLTADSSTATGLKWATPASGGMTSLASGNLAASTTGVDLQSISSAYQQLIFVLNNVSLAGSNDDIYLRFNNDSGSNYYGSRLDQGGSVGQDTVKTFNQIGAQGLNTFTGAFFYVVMPNYQKTNTNKLILSSSLARLDYSPYIAWRQWNNTSAINRITLISSTNAFDSGTYELFGVK